MFCGYASTVVYITLFSLTEVSNKKICNRFSTAPFTGFVNGLRSSCCNSRLPKPSASTPTADDLTDFRDSVGC